MDPINNSKAILLDEINLIKEYGFELPNNITLTMNNYLDEILFYNQVLKKLFEQKYGDFNSEELKKRKLEKITDKFLASLFELNDAINETYSFDPYKTLVIHMKNQTTKKKYNLSYQQIDTMLKVFFKNKLMGWSNDNLLEQISNSKQSDDS